MLIESLRAGNYITLKNALDFFIQEQVLGLTDIISNNALIDRFKDAFYKGLSKCLEQKEFETFSALLDHVQHTY